MCTTIPTILFVRIVVNDDGAKSTKFGHNDGRGSNSNTSKLFNVLAHFFSLLLEKILFCLLEKFYFFACKEIFANTIKLDFFQKKNIHIIEILYQIFAFQSHLRNDHKFSTNFINRTKLSVS